MANDIKWIKITTDIFNDDKILLIESLPESDSIIVIWFKLLTLAGKQNYSGILMMNDRVHYTDEMLATIFRRPLSTVRLALKTFENFGMIEIINNTITIPKWEKHQSIEGMEKAREQNRNRVARHREKQKQLLNSNVTSNESKKSAVTSNDGGNVTVTPSNALDKELDKELDIRYINNNSQVKEVIDYLNSKTNKNFRHQSNANIKIVTARFNDGYTIYDFKTVIDKKAAEWMGTEWEKYLQPSTLFREGNFDRYLNQTVTPTKTKTNVPQWAVEPETVVADMSPEAKAKMEELKRQMMGAERKQE